MRIHIIRHGMTDANKLRLYCGATDVPLNADGRRALAALRESGIYPSPKAAVYITSGLARADETLRLICGRGPDVVMNEFAEMNFGAFEMKSHDELKDDPEYQRWLESGCASPCPGGEGREVFGKRIAHGLRKLLKMSAESAVLVCHGGVIVSVMERLFPGQRDFYGWLPDCGRGYSLDIFAAPDESAALVAEI